MDTSLHYLTMANQMLIQKRLLERVKASGLTLGQPKVLDYLKEKDITRYRAIIEALNLRK
jgi:DNA-binding MarR family transcriptional regulator